MSIHTMLSAAAKNQTSAAVDVPSGKPILAQVVSAGAAPTAGTIKSEGSLDGVHYDATTYPLSFTYLEALNSIVKTFTSGFPFMRFTIAGLTFTYGSTQTTGTGLSDLTIAGTYSSLINHIYKIKISDADIDITPASALLTSTGTKPVAGSIVTLGTQPYTFRDTLTGAAAVVASVILTSSGVAPTDGDTVVLGSKTYMFKGTLDTVPDVANQVLIGGSAAVALDNLLLAVNAGVNTGNYGVGTTANADITATTNGDTTQLFVAKVAGAAGNALTATHPIGTTFTFPQATFASGADIIATVPFEVLTGANAAASLDNLVLAVNNGVANNGAGAGTTFGASTTANASLTATTNTDTTQLFVATAADSAGNAVASTVTGANVHLSFPAIHFTGGLNALGDKFEWNSDGGAYSSPILITGSAQNVADGMTVLFAAVDEHTVGDEWTITVPSISVYLSK
jgi:hypothetical protein